MTLHIIRLGYLFILKLSFFYLNRYQLRLYSDIVLLLYIPHLIWRVECILFRNFLLLRQRNNNRKATSFILFFSFCYTNKDLMKTDLFRDV